MDFLSVTREVAERIADLSREIERMPGVTGIAGDLFQLGEFTFHSGSASNWKIDCDALSEKSIETLAYLIAARAGEFSWPEGVPRGGIRLARALEKFATRRPGDPVLIVDDVCTTGASLETQRKGRNAVGYVIFARGPLPSWARALFVLDGLGRETHIREKRTALHRGRARIYPSLVSVETSDGEHIDIGAWALIALAQAHQRQNPDMWVSHPGAPPRGPVEFSPPEYRIGVDWAR